MSPSHLQRSLSLYDEKTTRREVISWCLYDFANSSYTTIIVTVAYSIYFTGVVADGMNGERLWGWGYSGSMLLVALLSPVLGAMADYGGLKKGFLVGFTILCISTTMALFFVRRGDVVMGMLLFALSNIGFNGGMHFYNSFLIDITTRSNIGRISGYGWALGYLGGLVSLLLVYPFIRDGFGDGNLYYYRLSFPLTGVFFLVASIPSFLFLKERSYSHRTHHLNYIRGGFRRLRDTFREIGRFTELVRYLFSYLIYTDGINTVIVFSAIFANRVLGFDAGEVVVYFIITQVSAGLGAWLLAPLTDKLGAKKLISVTLVVWILVVIGAYMVETKEGFYGIGILAGSVLGANQSASRALLGLLTPHGRNAEFFGFFAMTGKFAAVLGPLLYGEISTLTGDQRYAVLSLAMFFVVGFILLQMVDEERGMAVARRFEQEEKDW